MRPHLAAPLASIRDPLLSALEARAREQALSLTRTLTDRAEQEIEAITSILTELAENIEAELTPKDDPQLQLFNPDLR